MLLVPIFLPVPSPCLAATLDPPVLSRAEGEVTVKSSGAAVWRTTAAGRRLEWGDMIKTGYRSRAEVVTGLGTMRLYENSVLVIPAVDQAAGLWKPALSTGAGIFDLDAADTGLTFSVVTDQIAVGIRTARFTVVAGQDQSQVASHSGQLLLSDRQAPQPIIRELPEGFMQTVKASPPLRGVQAPLRFGPQVKLEGGDVWERWETGGSPDLKSPPPFR